jgi:hypothetical protein
MILCKRSKNVVSSDPDPRVGVGVS